MSNESFWFGNKASAEFAADEAATIRATREINAKTFLAQYGRRAISNIVSRLRGNSSLHPELPFLHQAGIEAQISSWLQPQLPRSQREIRGLRERQRRSPNGPAG